MCVHQTIINSKMKNEKITALIINQKEKDKRNDRMLYEHGKKESGIAGTE